MVEPSSKRIDNYPEFFQHYLNEHRNPTSRRLHFLGTGGFFASAIASAVVNPIGFGLAMGAFGLIGKHAMKVEEKKAPLLHVAAMVVIPSVASPVFFPAGIVCAYGCAWVGHFKFEKNRPATFGYPVWSLYSDMRMWTHMARGKLWSGTDPVEQLYGVDESAPQDRSTSSNGHISL